MRSRIIENVNDRKKIKSEQKTPQILYQCQTRESTVFENPTESRKAFNHQYFKREPKGKYNSALNREL